MRFASLAADVAQRVVVSGLVAGTLVLTVTSVSQARTLTARRVLLEQRVRELEAEGKLPEGAASGKVRVNLQDYGIDENELLKESVPK